MISSDVRSSGPSGTEPVDVTPVKTSGDSPADLQAEMAQTRAQLSETIDALQERLDPQRLKEQASATVRDSATRLKAQATEAVREATIGKLEVKAEEIVNRVEDTTREARYNIADAIRQNPIPAALVGVGLTWMFFSGTDRNSRYNRPYSRYPNDGRSSGLPLYGGIQAPPVSSGTLAGPSMQDVAQNVAGQAGAQAQRVGQQAQQLGNQAWGQVESATGQVKGTVQQLGGQAQDQVENLTGQVKGTVQQLGSQAQDQVENVTGQVKGTVQQLGAQAQDQVEGLSTDVQHQVQTLAAEVQEQAQRLSTSFDRVLQQNPLSVGAVALALGAAVGMIPPKTPQEDRLLGGAREQVMQKAQVAAHEALDRVEKIATDVQQQTAAAPQR